jgi:hypothetical protein
MTARHGIAAQMSTYPMDLRHLEHLLPHQIRALSGMVDRFVITIDTHQSRSGRYRVSNFDENLARMRQFIGEARQAYPQLQVADVDYSEEMKRAVAQYFFGVDSIPVKAWDGGPFYAYFFGLYIANAQYVFHIDGDIMFGGGSKTWMGEAIACMEERPDVLFTAPFPGPPRADGEIFGHGTEGTAHSKEPMDWPAYRHSSVSTRIFMIDLNRFKTRLDVLPLLAPTALQRLKSKLLGNPPEVREAEVVLSKTVHPPYRSEAFYKRLPELIHAVETDDVPDRQRGHYDLNDSMIDWTSAREANRWHRRYLRMIRHRLAS